MRISVNLPTKPASLFAKLLHLANKLAVPRERGDAALLDLANDVLVAFRGKTATTPIPVRFTPPPTLVGGVDYDDAMARRTVSVPFLCDFTA